MRINREKENGLMAIAAIILVALIALSMMVGCKTAHDVTEVFVRDTIHVSHTDTVRDKEITRIVLKESGDTIKVYNDHYIYRYIERNESTAVYKARVDSLLKILDKKQNEKKVIEKGPTMRDKLVYILIVACIIFCVFKWIKY